MDFQYLHINSKDRTTSSTSSTNFELKLDQALTIYSAQLESAEIPYTVYNVNTTNNTLVINWNSANSTITITPGNYTMAQLQSSLNTAFVAVNANLAVTLNTQTWKYTFDFSAATPSTGKLVLSQSTINRLIGFTSSTDTALSSTITSTVPALFMDQKYIFIQILEFGDNILSSTVPYKYTYYVPVDVNAGQLISYQNDVETNQVMVLDSKTKYYYLHIQATDEFGNNLNLNGTDWSMILKLYFRKPSQ